MKKTAVIINVTVNNEVYTVSYESGTVRTYKQATKPITAWLEAHGTEETITDNTEVSEVSEVSESLAAETTEEVVEETAEEPVEETALAVIAPAEVTVVEAEPEVTEEPAKLVEVEEVAPDQERAPEAPSFGWRDAAEVAKTTIKAIVAACKVSAPVIKAGCIGLWHLTVLVTMALVSLVKTIRLYGPDVIAELVTDVKVGYYKGKALYFRSRRLARSAMEAARKAQKAIKKTAGIALDAAASGLHILMGGAVVIALAAVKMASLVVLAAEHVAEMARAGWELRAEIIKEATEA